jgi:hypothetical protein
MVTEAWVRHIELDYTVQLLPHLLLCVILCSHYYISNHVILFMEDLCTICICFTASMSGVRTDRQVRVVCAQSVIWSIAACLMTQTTIDSACNYIPFMPVLVMLIGLVFYNRVNVLLVFTEIAWWRWQNEIPLKSASNKIFLNSDIEVV